MAFALHRRRLLWTALLLLIFIGALWAVRYSILRATGRFLITADAVAACDAIYVLGGAPRERGEEGARLWHKGVAPAVYCTGSNVPTVLEVVDMARTEAALSRDAAIHAGADSAAIHELVAGTSTWEESEAILHHTLLHGFDTITVVSTEFHLRRVRWVFRDRFAQAGITVLMHPARSERYDPDRWWASEEGLLMVNNEYVKLVYYLLRY